MSLVSYGKSLSLPTPRLFLLAYDTTTERICLIVIDIGNLAKWSVSSRKFGFGLQHLRDGNEETFWQSEGPQPHNIDLAFPRKVYISSVHICLSHSNDDSYTPERIGILLGTSHYDLVEVRSLHLDKPDGWGIYALRTVNRQIGEGADAIVEKEEGPPMPAFHVRVQIVGNHLNGKDTHVRGIRVFGVPG
ncbi:hypothetical protein FFLO_03097 [Filobasidium floriforme]|uniref:Anaphase-promoting complex subunit 10 n=1 Tax=Filobasidium floriforme TaxID=5210 RepID=A0A8K0NR47_9TREE|nr:galactose-binding domain-like protein [Filobasidium floriforme]KAG7548984.1 hypothetical protein FFLO_03097 [Filobasidium floriforme]KAH8089796.1 galactose-binding domain-like protein [Filobasidium floriforme]